MFMDVWLGVVKCLNAETVAQLGGGGGGGQDSDIFSLTEKGDKYWEKGDNYWKKVIITGKK